MAHGKIADIIEERQRRSQDEEVVEEKFFSAPGGEQKFLAINFRDGQRAGFSYSDLVWVSYDPENSSLDLEFNGFLVQLKGRGLSPRLFDGFLEKAVKWVREVDSDFVDSDEFTTVIDEIVIIPPEGVQDEAEEDAA
ncbi:MAG: hypothetical protein AAGA96_08370 [Verrucomicrobiota bacterium]